MIGLIFFLLVLTFCSLATPVLANEQNQYITIVNPVRISIYSSNPTKSLANQYKLIKQNKLPASWLLTFDALETQNLADVVKLFDKNQDIGIFMEVTENFTNAVGINYNKTDSWHRSTSVFLSGYPQAERIKLIDAVFSKFEEKFGYYPSSIGAWWIDSYSLDYMQKKYGITANLVVADQIDTDGYTVWGQFFGAPYYPSKHHAAIPAQNLENKLDVVNMQWAPRDPINGFISPTEKRASLYSTQDYYTINLTDEYLEKLINLYAGKNRNEFGQITFGLEGDFAPETYLQGGQFEKYIRIASKFQNSNNYNVVNMKQFSSWYRQNYQQLSPPYLIETNDLLGKNLKVIRFQTINYRISMILDPLAKSAKIIDFKIYPNNFKEPFFTSTNKQLDLYIQLPSVIDTAIYPNRFLEFRDINFLELLNEDKSVKLLFDKNRSVELEEDKITFSNLEEKIPIFLKESPYLKTISSNGLTILINRFPVEEKGYLFRDLTIEASFFLSQKKVIVGLFILGIVILLGLQFSPKKFRPFFLPVFLILIFSVLAFWYLRNSEQYYVSQAEIDALLKIKSLPKGKVLVLNQPCLSCHWNTDYKPSVFGNKRNYVSIFSNQGLEYENKLIESKSNRINNLTKIIKEEAASYLKSLGVKYIYLVKHEDYQEKLPYSPGDLGVEQIFQNSDAQIFRVK